MSARSEVADFLTGHLPEAWRVYPYGRDLDGIGRNPVVMVEQKTVSPGAAWGLWAIALEVSVIVGGDDPATVEDALEDALAQLLEALGDLPALSMSAATRGVVQESFAAYSVTVEFQNPKE